MIVAKTAINTLAYLKGHDYIEQPNDFDGIISQILTKKDSKISDYVAPVPIENIPVLLQDLSLTDGQHFCLITETNNMFKALVSFYDSAFNVLFCRNLSSPSNIHEDGIVCCWKERVDYRHSDHLVKIRKLSPV